MPSVCRTAAFPQCWATKSSHRLQAPTGPQGCHRLPTTAWRRAIWVRAAVETNSTQTEQLAPVRLSLEGLSSTERAEAVQAALADLDRPVLVSGVLPELDSEAWVGQLLCCLRDRETEFQVQGDQSSELCVGTLQQAINECVTDSSHGDAVFIMDEGLLADAAEELRGAVALDPEEWGPNWFELFPEQLRPSDCALIGGASARSTLHADPFSWQGYNYLLEGEKIWTFLPPETPRSSVLQAYRLEPNAWGDGEDDGIGLAAGWQSPVNLYWRRSDGRGSEAGVSDDGRSFSVPLGNGRCLRFRPSHELRPDTLSSAVSFIQREGELLLIPPDWWHQTYHLTATVAVASQLMNSHCEERVYRHMLRWTGAQEPEGLAELAGPRERIEKVVKTAVMSRYGTRVGPQIVQLLWQSSSRMQ